VTDEPFTFVSELGCTVSLRPPPDHLDHCGAMLRLRMEQDGDGRWMELYLSPENLSELASMISDWPDAAKRWQELHQ
jgi:hypothetical protein